MKKLGAVVVVAGVVAWVASRRREREVVPFPFERTGWAQWPDRRG